MISRQNLCPIGPLWIAFGLVEIQQHEAVFRRSARPAQMGEIYRGQFNARERIASTLSQCLNDEVNGQLRVV